MISGTHLDSRQNTCTTNQGYKYIYVASVLFLAHQIWKDPVIAAWLAWRRRFDSLCREMVSSTEQTWVALLPPQVEVRIVGKCVHCSIEGKLCLLLGKILDCFGPDCGVVALSIWPCLSRFFSWSSLAALSLSFTHSPTHSQYVKPMNNGWICFQSCVSLYCSSVHGVSAPPTTKGV